MHVCRNECTTHLSPPVRAPTTGDSRFDQLHVKGHGVADVHPAAYVAPGVCVEGAFRLFDLPIVERDQAALRSAQARTLTVHATRADDGALEAVAVLGRCALYDFLDVAV